MGAPNDVVSVDRLVRVITTTMADAYHYKDNWPTRCLAMLASVSRELEPLLKTFGRPLRAELGVEMRDDISGIVLKKWAYKFGWPEYVVCFSNNGWVLIRGRENLVYLDCPLLLANAIGDGIGGAQLFIDACAYAVEQLFRKRGEKLDELKRGCLLWRMYEACNCSKWTDTERFIRDLGR